MRRLGKFFVVLFALAVFCPVPAPAQQLAKRLILKDGSYQLATEWQVKGERVRYYSAERGEWEEVPNSMVDWEATDKYQKDREAGAPPPEVVTLDKEMEAERQADEAKSPLVAPGLRLPSDGDVLLLDSFQGEPQLLDLQQNGSDVNRNTKGNILRGAINPVASAKQSIELPGAHANTKSHATLPSIYVNQEHEQSSDPGAATLPWDRFRIVKAETKGGKRIVGNIKIAVYGKVSQQQKFIPTTATQLTGGWVKVTPTKALDPGEYAMVEMLGEDGMNLNVWDFAVNPTAPASPLAIKPEAAGQREPEKEPAVN